MFSAIEIILGFFKKIWNLFMVFDAVKFDTKVLICSDVFELGLDNGLKLVLVATLRLKKMTKGKLSTTI